MPCESWPLHVGRRVDDLGDRSPPAKHLSTLHGEVLAPTGRLVEVPGDATSGQVAEEQGTYGPVGDDSHVAGAATELSDGGHDAALGVHGPLPPADAAIGLGEELVGDAFVTAAATVVGRAPPLGDPQVPGQDRGVPEPTQQHQQSGRQQLYGLRRCA